MLKPKPPPRFRFHIPAKTANMRASFDDCEKGLREKASEKCEKLLCKAEKGSYRLRHSHKSLRSPVAQW